MTNIIQINPDVTEVDITVPENTVQVDTQLTEVAINVDTTTISPVSTETTISPISQEVTITLAGSQGPAGIPESDMVYAERVDFIGDIIYRAEAVPGTSDATAAWRIRRITFNPLSEDDTRTEWALGNALFDKIWNDYLTYLYGSL